MDKVNRAASLMGKRSAAARRKKWGAKEFLRRMRKYGKLGGRPKGKSKVSRGTGKKKSEGRFRTKTR